MFLLFVIIFYILAPARDTQRHSKLGSCFLMYVITMGKEGTIGKGKQESVLRDWPVEQPVGTMGAV